MTDDAITERMQKPLRYLCIVLGDQLNHDSLLWESFDATQDVIWMAEVVDESEANPSSMTRTLLFLSAMRHFANELRNKDWPVIYLDINFTSEKHLNGLNDALSYTLNRFAQNNQLPQSVQIVLPGDSRIKTLLSETTTDYGLKIDWLADQHFLAPAGEFKNWLNNRKVPIMEHWYRHIRKHLGILMDTDGKPAGGEWNFDKQNRKSFKSTGPDAVPEPLVFELDELSHCVIEDVNRQLNLVGDNALALWPVNRDQALQALNDFIEHKLPVFGDYQDAMWTDQPWLYHSRISSSLNLKLLHPAEVCLAAEAAYHAGKAPINAVEGFIRQIAGWREYIRGLYWSHHERWLSMNALGASNDLPDFYWTADTQMTCLSQSVSQVLQLGYGHHIQRLMVTGLFALLYGVEPQQIHRWYLAMYVDAVAWVEIPNTLGMSQYADGGIVGTKPYIASGAYINRMSNYCQSCPFDPKQAHGSKACPFTALYWQFIDTHQKLIGSNHRLRMQLNNWLNKSQDDRRKILQTAQRITNTLSSK